MGTLIPQTDDQKFFEAIKNASSIFDQPEDEEGKKENLKIIQERGEELGQGEPEDEEEEKEEKIEKTKTETN